MYIEGYIISSTEVNIMKKSKLLSLVTGVSLLAVFTACSPPGSNPATPPPATEPPATELVVVVDTATSPPPTEIPIQHQVFPVSLPANRSDHAGDYDSSVTAEEKKSNGGDRFTFERFERPFNARTMDVYFPELDIVDTFLYQDQTWIFGTIQVKDRPAVNSSPYRFGMQIDTEVDGKGDFLVLALNPNSTDWTTDGVQVYEDSNSDVGFLTAMLTDEEATGDGFETLIFDQGRGDDPDVAWVRVSPNDPNTVEIAIKRSILGNPARYMVDMWTGHGTLDPALFDYNDHFTHEQAGAADPGFPNFYPIKSVHELDNTCRMAVGFEPTGEEPGVCETPSIRQPVVPGTVGGCTASQQQILACEADPSYDWDPVSCTCNYIGPR
jgi:hypothetical protein